MIRVVLLFFSVGLLTLSARNCEGDGVHAEIDIRQLKIQYSGISMRGTFDAIGKLGVDAKIVQTAAEETQR